MHWVLALFGVALIVLTLRDAFMAILLPRTVSSGTRLTSRVTSYSWRFFSRLIPKGRRNEDNLLALFGPFSICLMIVVWAILLIFGFACVISGLQENLSNHGSNFGDSLYFSGVTFLTLGFGDLVAISPAGRAVTIIEAGTGFAFLAIVVSYLPVLYGSFSRRESLIILMDARAGSPPSGGEMLRRFAESDDWEGLVRWLERWETWEAELLETILSYPTLAFYRSQHGDTSWLCAMTSILDACVLIQAGLAHNENCVDALRQAKLTYAMGRHALIDISQVFNTRPEFVPTRRLTDDEFNLLWLELAQCKTHPQSKDEMRDKLDELRLTYEPYSEALSMRLRLRLPRWTKDPAEKDNWETSQWERHI